MRPKRRPKRREPMCSMQYVDIAHGKHQNGPMTTTWNSVVTE